MQFNSLPLHIETRIKAEIENWRRRASSGSKEEEEVIDPFITISRQYGCNAFALAEALASSLDDTNLFQPFTIYGKGILKMISEEEDIHSNLVRSLNRGTHNEIEDWLVSLFSGVPSEFATYKRMAKTICAIAARGHVILIDVAAQSSPVIFPEVSISAWSRRRSGDGKISSIIPVGTGS